MPPHVLRSRELEGDRLVAQKFRLLTEDHVKSLLPMSDLIASMESSLGRFSAGEVLQPVRTVLMVGPTRAYFGLMPAFIPHPASLGAKLVTVFSTNAARRLPSHLATILLLDPETGALQAIMDGRYITEARTAAVSAVSVRHLARTDAATVAIIGTGVQAQSHVEALPHVRPLREIRVWSPNATSRDRFARDMRDHAPVPLRITQSAEDAVRGADVIVLVTSSPTPVIEDSWVSDGAHVISVGACRPDQRESRRLWSPAGDCSWTPRRPRWSNRAMSCREWPKAASTRSTSSVSSASWCSGRCEAGQEAPRSRSSNHSGWQWKMWSPPTSPSEGPWRQESERSYPMKTIPRWVQIVGGIAIVLAFLAIGAVVIGISWMREHVDIVDSSETEASRAFDEVHARFPGQKPLLELRDRTPHYVEERASKAGSSATLSTMHVVAWDTDERRLAKIDVPWWILRMKSGSISFSSYSTGLDDAGVKLTPEEIERHGPGLLLDFTMPGEGRVLIWTE